MHDALDTWDRLLAALEKLEGLAAVLPALPSIPDHPACMLSGLGYTMQGLIEQARTDARALIDAKEGRHG